MVCDPYSTSFPTSPFEVRLPELDEAGALPRSAYALEGNRSPTVAWGTLPAGTRSLVVTAFDPDAPIPGGFWHWLIKDVPAEINEIASGAGESDRTLPQAAVHVQASMGQAHYAGVRPPPGTGTHHLFVCVTALDVDELDVTPDAGPARLLIAAIPHTLGRGIAIGTSQAPQLD